MSKIGPRAFGFVILSALFFGALPFYTHAEPAREQGEKSEQRKCLEACQHEVGQCMDKAKDKAHKQACADAAISCLKGCGMGPAPTPEP